MHIFLSAGEPSGDLHAANLIRSIRKLQPDARFVGFGGDRIREEGAELLYPVVDLAVMWFLRVLLNIHKFIGLVRMADAYFAQHRPDAVVLVDYPGLNWWIARRAKERGIPVFYYVPPQIWAWAGWRVEKVRRYVDHVLCSLPFEPRWYHERGVASARHIGHPYFDELAERVLDTKFLDAERAKGGRMVAILPGSRTQEVIRNMPIMLRAAARLHREFPSARFVVACFRDRHRGMVEAMLASLDDSLPLEIHVQRTPELIRLADVAWAVSGSVGLELMMEALPSVVLYKVRPIDLVIARPFIKARFISLVNLLADEEVMPEYLTARDVSAELASWAMRWLSNPDERARASSRLARLRDVVAIPGACDRAAEAIVGELRRPAAHPLHHHLHARGTRSHPAATSE